jgi:hypothetical protein
MENKVFEVEMEDDRLIMTFLDGEYELMPAKDTDLDLWGQEVIDFKIDVGPDYCGVYSFSLQ